MANRIALFDPIYKRADQNHHLLSVATTRVDALGVPVERNRKKNIRNNNKGSSNSLAAAKLATCPLQTRYTSIAVNKAPVGLGNLHTSVSKVALPASITVKPNHMNKLSRCKKEPPTRSPARRISNSVRVFSCCRLQYVANQPENAINTSIVTTAPPTAMRP